MHIAITGSIGSGKSSVSRILRSLGYPVFDSDAIAKAQYDDPEVKTILNAYFKEDLYPNGVFDPVLLSRLIFDDARPDARHFVEALIHPRVFAALEKMASESQSSIVFSEVPLLFEAHGEEHFDRVLAVITEPSLAEKRLMTQRGMTLKEIRRRLAYQLDPKIKAALADDVLENNGDEAELVKQVTAYSDKIKSKHGSQ